MIVWWPHLSSSTRHQPRSRSPAGVLAGWRRQEGLSLAEASKRAGFSTAKLSMMENALQPSKPVDIMALGYACGIPTPEWQSLSERAQSAAQQRQSDSDSHGTLFDPAIDFMRIYADVVRLRVFQSNLIPSILQTHDYTLAVMKADDPLRAAVNTEQRRQVNMAWHARLHESEPLAVEAVVHEAAITQVVGGPRTMNAQLLHLVKLSELSNVTIQVITRNAGAYPAMGFPFAVLLFAHRQHDDVVYVESFLRGDYFEDQHDCERCAHRFAALQRVALSPADSVELIAEAASRLRPAA